MWPGYMTYDIYLYYSSDIENILLKFSFINTWSFICPVLLFTFIFFCILHKKELIERLEKEQKLSISHFNNKNNILFR